MRPWHNGLSREEMRDARWAVVDRMCFAVWLLVVGLVVAVPLLWLLLDQWWISVHCTMVLGTRVCQQ